MALTQAMQAHAGAVWPWTGAVETEPAKGVRRWHQVAGDGTQLDLVRFDFAANPKLRFEMYDQDEDDVKPFDDHADFWPNGVGAIVKHLHEKGRGPVAAAWNGMFFAYDSRGAQVQADGLVHMMATHIGPAVLYGKYHYNVGNHRWTFGVKQGVKGPEFKALYKPDKATMVREFDFASAGAQLLINEGKAMSLEPGDGPDLAGARLAIDTIRTTRVSMAWSKDNRQLFLLVAQEGEAAPNGPIGSGWNLFDLQQFWMAIGAWGAVNADGGATAQFALRLKDGRYEVMPCQVSGVSGRPVFGPELNNTPPAGTLMTYFVRQGE